MYAIDPRRLRHLPIDVPRVTSIRTLQSAEAVRCWCVNVRGAVDEGTINSSFLSKSTPFDTLGGT